MNFCFLYGIINEINQTGGTVGMNTDNKTSLVILAAGFGTRFHNGIKQLTPVGPQGELLMEYSVKDAVRAGFDKVIFVIRRDIEQQFRDLIGKKIEGLTDVKYCFQNIGSLPNGFTAPPDRTKPWGTVHALLSAKCELTEPFGIINADDYYGKSSYKHLHDHLASSDRPSDCHCMIGFILKNTLSSTGSVTRAICIADRNGYLDSVHETYHINADDSGVIYGDCNDSRIALDPNRMVSMNMWGFDPSVIPELEKQFIGYLEKNSANNSSEYPIPAAVDSLIRSGRCRIKVIPTDEKWFGMTYAEDIEDVRKEILLRDGADL